MSQAPKIVVAISGASGAIYAKRLLDHLRKTPATVAIVMSDHARQIWDAEVGTNIRTYDYRIYDKTDFNAPFASGSNVWDALAIVPCSMGMLGRIVHGFSDDLIARAADVFMKERRQIIVMPRETPFNLIHIENMKLATLAGITVMPASPSFYSGAKTLEEAVDTVVHRVLDHLPLEKIESNRWGQ